MWFTSLGTDISIITALLVLEPQDGAYHIIQSITVIEGSCVAFFIGSKSLLKFALSGKHLDCQWEMKMTIFWLFCFYVSFRITNWNKKQRKKIFRKSFISDYLFLFQIQRGKTQWSSKMYGCKWQLGILLLFSEISERLTSTGKIDYVNISESCWPISFWHYSIAAAYICHGKGNQLVQYRL